MCSVSIRPRSRRASAARTRPAYHDPFVLFGFLAGVTKKIGFAAGVLILAQRQAALVAKQAASLDALCEGRFRSASASAGTSSSSRASAWTSTPAASGSAEQVRFMQALWAKPGVTFKGKYHELTDGGINPRPKSARCRSGSAAMPSRR
jgi:alkanesulfonate monooxygenase SsuD/methylene tetrahydromethanopterin reductase-like flavin-dependent oxidoreductase (luciferase family)